MKYKNSAKAPPILNNLLKQKNPLDGFIFLGFHSPRVAFRLSEILAVKPCIEKEAVWIYLKNCHEPVQVLGCNLENFISKASTFYDHK